MSELTLEEQVLQIKATCDILAQQEQRMKDRAKIENLMNTYQYYLSAYETEKILSEIWAQRALDVHAEFGSSGVYCGLDSIRRAYASFKKYPGRLYNSFSTTPVIEVAEDGKTAKGLWTCTGTESDSRGKYKRYKTHGPYGIFKTEKPEVKPMAQWIWEKYGADFILENGQWRLWHLHVYDIFRCPFDEDWISYSMRREKDGDDTNIVYPPADLPSTCVWHYKPDAEPPKQPYIPGPYKTFADTFSY